MAQFLVLIILYNINLGSTTTGSFFLVLFIHGMSIWHLLFLFLLSFLISYLSGKLAHFFLFQPFRNTCYVTKFVFHSFKQNSLNAVFHHVRQFHFEWCIFIEFVPDFSQFVTISSTNSSSVVFESALHCRGFTVHLFILIIFISDHVLFRIE